MPKISILMGIYNEKKKEQVIKAIDSILNQTYKDFEFIICDDGSESALYQWLKNYCEKDVRIHLIRKEKNEGLASALNTCLANAKGDYIARMDADDISEPERLEKQTAFLEQHSEYAMVGCNAVMIDDNGSWGKRELPATPQKEDFLRTSPFIHPSIMIRTNVLKKLGGYCEAKYAERTEDYELFMRLYAAGYKGRNIEGDFFCYREDRYAFGKRKYRYRINESRVRYYGFRELGILKGHSCYVLKPLLVGLLPKRLIQRMRRRQFGECK